MSYYVSAYRNGKMIRLPVEDKHWYNLGVQSEKNLNTLSLIKIIKPVKDPLNLQAMDSTTKGTSIDTDNISLLFAGGSFRLLSQGTSGDEQFIADKIYIKNIKYTIGLRLMNDFITNRDTYASNANYYYKTANPSLIDYTISSENYASFADNFYANFRIMLVKFTDPLVNSEGVGDNEDSWPTAGAQSANAVRDLLKEWFNQSRIYLDSTTNYDNQNQSGLYLNECVQPVYTDSLRNSSIWTGKFKVLWDEKVKLTKSNPSLFFEKSFVINQNVNLVGTTGGFKISGDTLKNTYLFIIGPTCLAYDVDGYTYKYMNSQSSSSVNLAHVDLNTKITYYDI